jgi:phosphoribosylanthranilate isomerase
MVRSKVCGITTVDDARMVCASGVDALGVNLFAGPRRVSVDEAAALAQVVRGKADIVGLIGWPLDDELVDSGGLNRLQLIGIRTLQVYGVRSDRDMALLRGHGFDVWVPVHVADESFVDAIPVAGEKLPMYEPNAVLLDATHGTKLGGTGKVIDWGIIERARKGGLLDRAVPLVLAGGLHEANVGEAIRRVQPWMVDVSSGVELSPGRKSAERVGAFVDAVREACS